MCCRFREGGRKGVKMAFFAILASRRGLYTPEKKGPKRGQNRPKSGKIRVFPGGPENPRNPENADFGGSIYKVVKNPVHHLSRLGELLNTLKSAHGGPSGTPRTPISGGFGGFFPSKLVTREGAIKNNMAKRGQNGRFRGFWAKIGF